MDNFTYWIGRGVSWMFGHIAEIAGLALLTLIAAGAVAVAFGHLLKFMYEVRMAHREKHLASAPPVETIPLCMRQALAIVEEVQQREVESTFAAIEALLAKCHQGGDEEAQG